jgi:two-component system, cell cycle sensor histidine kinase and response regulator CckA
MNKKPTYTDLQQRIKSLEEATGKIEEIESTLKNCEEKFAESFLKSPIPMVITAMKDGRYVEVNEAFAKAMGLKREELLGNTSTGAGYITGEQRKLFLDEYSRKGSVENLELQVRVKGGELRHGLVNSSKITIGCEDFFLTMVTDITEHERLKEELLKARKLESVGTLAGGIAHDFNNLLAGIHGYIEMAKMDIPPGTRSHEYLLASLQSTRQAAELTKRLITFSKGGGPVKSSCDIGELVKDTVQRAMVTIPIEKKFIMSDDLWMAEVDEGQIRQVVRNIIANAIEAMPEGGLLTVSAENLTVSGQTHLPLSEGPYLLITIKDTGVGISAEDLPLIFDPYFSTKRRGPQKGMGLGLSVSHSILSKHAGCIIVESKPGEGSTFHVYLPALIREKPSEKLSRPEKIQGTQKRILVMDDEEVIRDMIGQLLQSLGYEVTKAQDGLQAIDLYVKAREADQSYGLLILDLTIKRGMGGVQTMKRLREIDPQVKAIIFSGYTNDPVIENYNQYGFLGALTKPFKREELKTILENNL